MRTGTFVPALAGLLAVLAQPGTAAHLRGNSRRLQSFPVVDAQTYFLGTNQAPFLADLNYHNFVIPEAISRSFEHNLASDDGLLEILLGVGYFTDPEFRTNGLDFLLSEGAVTQSQYDQVLLEAGQGSLSLAMRPVAMLGLLADVASFDNYQLNWQIVVWNGGTMLGRVRAMALDYDLRSLPGYSAATFYASLDSFKLSCGGWYTLGRGDTLEREEFALVPFEDLYNLAVDYVGADQPLPDYSRWSWVPWPDAPPGAGELLVNAEFSNGLSGWSTYVQNPAANFITAPDGTAQFSIGSPSSVSWHVQLYQTITALSANELYTLSADIQSVGGPVDVELVVEQNGGTWATFGRSTCSVVAATVTRCSVTADVTIAGGVKFVIMGGNSAGDFIVDNVSASLSDGQQPAPSPAPAPTSLFTNGDFQAGLDGWRTYVNGGVLGGAITASNGEVVFSLDAANAQPWYMQLHQDFTVPAVDQSYRLSVDVQSSGGAQTVQLYMQQSGSPWTPFASSDCVAGAQTTTCTLEGSVSDVSIPVKFGIQSGTAAGAFTVDNMVLETI